MVDTTTEISDATISGNGASTSSGSEPGFDFSERYSQVIGKINETLDTVDWNLIGKVGKASGILLAVIVVQILIKGVLDTINLLPIIPGLLELLGLVVVGQWSWQNLTTGEKRTAVMGRIQALRKDYLG